MTKRETIVAWVCRKGKSHLHGWLFCISILILYMLCLEHENETQRGVELDGQNVDNDKH